MAPRNDVECALTVYPYNEYPNLLPFYVENGRFAINDYMAHEYGEFTARRELLRLYVRHSVRSVRRMALWRLQTPDSCTRLTYPMQPMGSHLLRVYRLCYGSRLLDNSSFCCVNGCSHVRPLVYKANGRPQPCQLCHALEYTASAKSAADDDDEPTTWRGWTRPPQCRCLCRAYCYDMFWTRVGMGTFVHRNYDSRQTTFVNPTTGRPWFRHEATTHLLLNGGFAIVPATSQQHRWRPGPLPSPSMLMARCVGCLFSRKVRANAIFDDVRARELNRHHCGYNPHCTYVSHDKLSCDFVLRCMRNYHTRFQTLRAIDYMAHSECWCRHGVTALVARCNNIVDVVQ